MTAPSLASNLEKGRTIRSMFGRIAQPYDFLNRFFSLGIDLWWRQRLVSLCLKNFPKRHTLEAPILDLATGSGDVARMFLRRKQPVLGCDFCVPMMLHAQKKGVPHLVAGDAQQLPFSKNSFAACTIAFGLRNFTDRPLAFQEIRRVLKPGAFVHVLEFTHPQDWFCGIYFFYLKHIMPKIAAFFCRDPEAYAYLARTVEQFPRVEQISSLMEQAGFEKVTWVRMTLGIVAIHSGKKPNND
jgi:demethylmenaquinone methyltransferase / 2-methoxy-6-polyprenyl-1,4-benzoquinol methylase